MLSTPGASAQEPRSRYEHTRIAIDHHTIVVFRSGAVVFPEEQSIISVVEEALKRSEPSWKGVLVGSDEAGKGERVGPLVVASVALEWESAIALKARGLVESKHVSAKRLYRLAELIRCKALAHHVTVLEPKKLNQLMAEYRRRELTLNDLLAELHAIANMEVLKMLPKAEEVRVVVDLFDKEKVAAAMKPLAEEWKFELVQETGAERYAPVAAASILAREARERWLERASEKLGIDLRKASVDEIAQAGSLEKYVKTFFSA